MRKKAQTSKERELPKALLKNDKDNISEGNLDKKNKKDKSKNVLKIVIIFIVILIICFGTWLGIITHRWKKIAKDMLLDENSVVKDTNSNVIAKLGSEKKKEKTKLSDMPNNLKNAYVAIEDERFYSHGGVDAKRTGAAIASYVLHGGSSTYGGSTITQQLVKNLTGDSTDSISRKIKEWWKAFQIETCTTKDQLLEAYLNIIYVGPNIYGVEAGSKYYFSKSSKDLTLEECAFLAGINNSPNSYSPFENKDNSEKIKKRTKIVLSKMLELKYIDQESYNNAVAKVDSGLKFKKGDITSGNGVYSYHTDALIPEVTKDIQQKYHISETFATNYINMAGLTIYSTQNTDIQTKTENEFEKSKYSLASKNGGNSSQAAMVIIDHKTGYVTGCTGGLGKKTEPRSLNRATQSIRQTGSAIKPIAVLAPAISKKMITAASIYDDTERDFAEGYHPTDYNPSLGKVTVRRAVESSQNIPFVEIMEKLKPSKSIKFLEKMGVTTLTEEDNNLVLALGGLQKGISPLEMAGAYATIANDGVYIEPTFYNKIENKDGTLIIKSKQKSRRVFSKEVAYILKEILTQPVTGTNGTATYCAISGIDVAAKTGTTDENYDRWLCGFTPYYTAVTWYGYDQNESIHFNKKNPAGLLWANVMSRIHTGLKTAKFEKPSTVTSVTICPETGKKARTGCQNTYTEYFLWGTVPGLCDKHNGNEFKNNNDTNNEKITNKVQEIVQGITEDIDSEDPQQTILNSQQNTNKNTTTKNNDSKNDTKNTSQNKTNVTNNTNSKNTTNTTKQNTSSNTNTSQSTNSNKNNANSTSNSNSSVSKDNSSSE